MSYSAGTYLRIVKLLRRRPIFRGILRFLVKLLSCIKLILNMYLILLFFRRKKMKLREARTDSLSTQPLNNNSNNQTIDLPVMIVRQHQGRSLIKLKHNENDTSFSDLSSTGHFSDSTPLQAATEEQV